MLDIIHNTKNMKSGKYIAYLTSIEGSSIIWSDDLEEIKKEWCMGRAIFESNGIDSIKLKEIFPTPPERGVILDYFSENLPLVLQEGALMGKINPKREVLMEKETNKKQ